MNRQAAIDALLNRLTVQHYPDIQRTIIIAPESLRGDLTPKQGARYFQDIDHIALPLQFNGLRIDYV